MAKQIVTTYTDGGLDRQRRSDYSSVEHFNAQCLPLLQELGTFKARDINAYSHYDNNPAAVQSAYLAKCMSGAEDEAQREYIRARFPDMWRNYAATHYLPYFPRLNNPEYVHFDETENKFVLDFDAYKITREIVATTPEETRIVEKLRELEKIFAALSLSVADVRALVRENKAGGLSVVDNLTPDIFEHLKKKQK